MSQDSWEFLDTFEKLLMLPNSTNYIQVLTYVLDFKFPSLEKAVFWLEKEVTFHFISKNKPSFLLYIVSRWIG